MNCIPRSLRLLPGAFLLLVLAFSPACGDDFPDEANEDVAALDDITNDIGSLDTKEADDVVEADSVGDTEEPDASVGDVSVDVGGEDATGDATDGGSGDASDGGADAGQQCPGDPGCACEEDKDCDAGACLLDNAGKKACAAPCKSDDDCASPDICQDVSGTKVCVPGGAALCAPCVSNNACQYGDNDGVCVAGGGDGSFCGTGCKDTADCGKGYSCEDVKDVDGKEAKQCVPENKGLCACSGYAIAKSAKTTCFAAGLPGCTSTRACLADGAAGAPAGGGLSKCTTKAPAKEICDGLDNNCDGQTDEDGAKGCDDANPCTADTCDGGKGCVNKKLDGQACDDGDACTKGDTCAVGLCAGATVACDDSNPCTDDSCDLATGCTTTNNSASCDDGDACTKGDACAVGLCTGATVACDDSNPCTDDSCDMATGCTTTNNSSTCDDNTACTKGDTCAAGLCTGVKLDCDDSNACTTDSCDVKLGCQNKTTSTGACDDGTACTTGDTCATGVCTGKKLDCDDKNPCTDDVCDATSGCKSTANTATCSDGSACTEKDACTAGACVGVKKSCEDGNACTDDSCDTKKGCVYLDNGKACDDSNACSVKDACTKGKCAGSLKTCDDGNVCTVDSCDKVSGNCSFKPLLGNACTDGNACTEKDACNKDGKCAGQKLDCEDGKTCTDDPCDPKKGCAAKVFSTKACDDGSVCTSSDTCDGKGACLGKAVVCDDNNPCTDDSCDAKTGCKFANNKATCSDGDDCTKNDACVAGKCTAGSNVCQCQSDKDCVGQGTNLCNGALVCKSNKCVVSATNVVKCKGDNNSCTIDACTPKTGKCDYAAVKDGTTCDADGSKCTSGDSCQSGKCAAGKKLVCDDSKPCTADSCDAKTGCVNAVLKTGGVTLLNFNAYPGDDGKLGTKDDKPAVKNDGVSKQFSSYGLTFGLVGGGVPRVHTSTSLPKAYAPNVLRPVDPKATVTASNYKDIWVKLDKPAMRVKIMVLDVHTKEASALKAYNAKGVMIASAKHPGGAGGLTIPLEVKVDGTKGWIARIVVDLTNGSTSATGPELYDNFEFEWVPGCDDGNICTEPDTCDRTKGACLAGGVKNCDDGNQCTKDSCDASLGCKNVALDKVPCEDGNKCTDGDQCTTGTCTAGKKKGCDDGKPCTADSCDPKTGCVYKALKDGDKCTDNNACTTPDACKAAKCVPGAVLKCDDGDLCTADSCDPKTGCKATPIAGCGVKPLPLPYFEPFACGSKSGELWKITSSQKSPTWAIDASPTKPAAYSPKCSLNFNDGTNYACKTGATKVEGYAHSPQISLAKTKLPVLTFQLGGDWESGVYDDVQLQISTNGTSWKTLGNYDDAGNNAWTKKTVALTAYAGQNIGLRFRFYTLDCQMNATSGAFIDDVKIEETACQSNASCNDGNGCTVDVCSLATGKCIYSSAKNGTKCDDGNLCNIDTCQSGKCTAGPDKKCLNDLNACTGPAQCQPKTGKCLSEYTESCDDQNPCTSDVCNSKTGGCTHQTLKVCQPKCKTSADCFDSNPCSIDLCNKAGVCEWSSVAAQTVCGEGKVCGKGTQCVDLKTGWARNISGQAYGYHYCVTTSNGGVACWGRNNYYQTGYAASTATQSKPRVVDGLKGIKSVKTGRYHSCALSSTGEVWCWGRNNYGQSAPGLKAILISKPQKVAGLLGVRKLALGTDHTCVHHADRTVSCWGYNSYGQLGHGNTTTQFTVKKVAGLTGVLDIAADYYHTCVIRTDGQLYCTGANGDRQTSELVGNRNVFTKRGGTKFPKLRQAMAGYQTSCVGSGSVWGCVGNSFYGAMGNGSTADAITPVMVNAGKQPIAQVSGGYFAHYALAQNGDVYGAGYDVYGSFGLSSTAFSRTTYFKTGFPKAADVDGAYRTACVLTLKGAIYCSGYAFYGNLGNGGSSNTSKPVLVTAPCTTAATCDDGDPCTADSCKSGSCTYVSLSKVQCDDGDPCTVGDICTTGKCGGKPALCDDKNACTVGDKCVVDGGLAKCVPGIATKCDDKDKCTADSCDKVTGKCVFKPIVGCIQACKQDLDCDDGNPCTENKCLAGGCQKKSVNEGMLCDEAKLCTAGQCAPSGNGWAAKLTTLPNSLHVCALGTDAKIYCWGSNVSYRSGQASTANITKPKAVPGITGATDVVAGYDHTCAKAGGKWVCWGDNTSGQLGNGSATADTSKPLAVTVATNIVKLTAGYRYTCALRVDGSVTCWGSASSGRLGYGSTSSNAQPKGVTVKGLTNAVDLWSADGHSCATVKTGEIYCWGSNSDRRIADSTTTTFYAPVKKVGAMMGLAGGNRTVCWPAAKGTGWCTGDNFNGQLGNGSTTDSGKPVQVVGPKGIVHVAGGGDHSTALTMTGKLWTAGDNDNGQLGIGSKLDSKKFVAVEIPGGKQVIQVRSGSNFTCVLLADGNVLCSGNGSSGEQGDGSTADDLTFTAAAGPCTSLKQCNDGNACTTDSCAAGACSFTPNTLKCSDGKGCTTGDICTAGACVGKPVVCDDKNACTVGDACVEDPGGLPKCVVGKLKECDDKKACTIDSCDSASGVCSFKAIPGCLEACKTDTDCDDANPCTDNKCLAGKCSKQDTNEGLVCAVAAVCKAGVCAGTGKGWAAKISGSDAGEHFCALGTDAKAYCWGSGGNGRLGDGATSSNYKPTVVVGLTNLKDVIACDTHSCALTKTGKAFCWGDNSDGQLGNGTSSFTSVTTPAAVVVSPTFLQLACGQDYTCGLLPDGKVKCWGSGFNGRLGYGVNSSTDQPKGVTVKGLTGVAAIEGFDDHACAIKADGTVWCWGENYEKPLQNTTTTRYFEPVQKKDATGATFIQGAADNVCWGLGGKAFCAGDNDNGQLGDGKTIDSAAGVQVVGPKFGVSSIAGGLNFNSAVSGAGGLWSVGDNLDGQLGLGNKSDISKWTKVNLGAKKVVQAAAISYTQCFLTNQGAVYCAGNSFSGRLGTNSTSSVDQPTFVMTAGPCSSAQACDDGDPCTLDTCKAGSCAYQPNLLPGVKCDDGKGCTSDDVCSAGKCSGKAVVCDDKNPCTVGDACVEGKTGAPMCMAGAAKMCDDSNPCTADSCDKTTGACVFKAITDCNIGCKTKSDCDDANTCTDDICDLSSGKCSFKSVGAGNVCAVGAICISGKCAPVTKGWAKAITSEASGRHVCALRHDKTVACWGRNSDGQVGNNSKVTTRKPVVVGGLSTVKKVVAGFAHTCALREDGKLYCWGRNSNGECGTGVASSTDLLKPALATKVPPLSDVWAGYDFTCGRSVAGDLLCWGDNYYGTLGNGLTADSAVPVKVVGLSKSPIVAISTDARRTCGRTAAGDIYCWGYNYSRDVNTLTGNVTTPTKRSNVAGIGVFGGGNGTLCAVQPAKQQAVCWGDGGDGELGYGSKISYSAMPQVVKGMGGEPVMFSGGDDHTLMVTTTGAVYSAGDGYYRQTALGSTADALTFKKAAFKAKIVAIVGAYNTTCALSVDGEVYCIGDNYYGTAGTNSTSSTVTVVSKVLKP